MVTEENKSYWSTLKEVEDKVLSVIKRDSDSRDFGTCTISNKTREELLNSLEYLKIIENSDFSYIHIQGLTEISNFLKTL